MSNKKVKGLIENLFDEIREEVSDLIRVSPNSTAATESITEYVSSKITASSKGYITTLYSELSKATLAEPIFENDVNANKFYDLELKQKIYSAYQFDVSDLSAYQAGITSKEINVAYATAGAVVGGIIGSVIGYMAGSMVGRLAARGRQMMRNFTGEILGIARKNMKDIWDSARIGLAEVFG